MTASPVDVSSFKRILARNVALPLAVGVVSAGLFLAIVFYMLNVMSAVEHSERVIGQANRVVKLMVDQETGVRGFLITGDESFLQPYTMARTRFGPVFDTLKEMVADNPAQQDRLRQARALQLEWDRFATSVVEARRRGGDFLTPVKEGRGKNNTDEVRRQFEQFIDDETALREERSTTARRVVVSTVSFYLLFSLGVAGLLAYFGRRELMRLSNTYGDALAQQSTHNEFLQQQTWLRTGESELATQTAGQESLAALSRSALEFVARYLDAAVGAFYVREDDGSLRRVASYAFGDRAGAHGEVLQPRESLVGQAVDEGRVIRLDEVNPDYIKVSSGLGEAAPRHLLIAPFNNEGKINGALEIGFMRPLTQRETEFLNAVGDNLGASVAAARYRQRLQEVLSETQQLNEELQVQQEELRTANEELEEQSRVLEEAQTNLENQQAELEQTNEQLSAQAVVLDQRNTALNDARLQLEDRARELERASRYKSEFLANMSHELRTPLNSSLILAKLLSENAPGNLNEEQVRFAQTIYSAGNDLLNLINDILDISKVEAGKLELDPEQLPLRRAVESLAMIFEPLAMQKQLEFRVEFEPQVPAALYTDRQRLEQILKNLLSNAIKFTDRGSIVLQVRAAPPGQVSFAVTDSGIGIRRDQQEIIFEAFRQADGSTARKYGGTGLGLSISRDLAHLLGGTITVESEEGQGSTFILTLPLDWSGAPAHDSARADVPHDGGRGHAARSLAGPAAAANDGAVPRRAASSAAGSAAAGPRGGTGPGSAAGAPANAESFEPLPPPFPDDRDAPADGRRTVLVVEDEPEFAHILYDLAHDMGYRCIVALVAQDGLALAATYLPDAVLLDVRLPDRSGLSVLEQLKDTPSTRHIPVHIVSASEDHGAALHMGAVGYARKPTSRAELEQVFRKLEDKFTQKIKRILLVEDDPRQRESVVHLIEDDDIEIRAVASGEEALELLKTTIFDCMIIDLKLPDMQGNELLQRMSLEDICSFPPVIVYTGRNLTREEEADLMRYSRSIIIKGARSPERLLDEVTLFLHKVESELSSERQTMLRTVRSRDRVFEGRTILLVDDDVRNVFALTSALEQKGVKVEVGRNGFEALEKLDSTPEIDLVLMDVMMPGMDGLEATRRIRADQRFGRLPIIAITAKAMKDDQEQCLAAGANDYLAKPIDLARLYSLLRVWMPTMDRL